jgi:uncharacterized protein YciI
MIIRYGLKLILAAGLVASVAGSCAMAETVAQIPSKQSFLIRLTAVPANTPEEQTARKRSVLPSAVYWDNLYNVGKVSVLGSAQDGGTTFSVVILQGVSEDEARSIAEGVPSVKAGVTTAEVLPLQVLQARSQTRQKLGR